MDAQTPPRRQARLPLAPEPPHPARPHRITVNVDSVTLALLDEIAAMARESRSSVVADVLQSFAPMFKPVAEAIAQARTNPAKAVEMMAAQAESMRTLTAELIEVAKRGPGAAGDASAAPAAPGPAPGKRRSSPPPSNTGGISR